MMETENRVEFYKVRSIGERFSAAGDFVRQNWKVLLRNIVYIGAPLAIIQGYLSHKYMDSVTGMFATPSFGLEFVIGSFLMIIVSVFLSLFLIAMSGTIMYQYTHRTLREDSGWSDLSGNMFSMMGKLFLQGVIIFFIIAIPGTIAGVLIGGAVAAGEAISGVFGGIVAIVLILALIPSFALMPYPIFFEQASAWEAITKGFKLGFRNWGAVFLTALVAVVLGAAVSYILSLPYMIYLMYTMFATPDASFLGYVLAALASLVTIIISPIINIFIGFQYTSIIEKEEGVSQQEKIVDFDQL